MIAAELEPIYFDLYEPQAGFMDSQALVRGFVGGRGAGKSWTGAMDLLNRAKANRFYFVGAPTYKMLADASWRMLLSLAKQRHMLAEHKMSPPWIRLRNGAEIIGRSADDPETFRGPNLSGAWVDEASRCEKAAYLLLRPCLREGGEMGWLSSTFTPRGKKHWTYQTFTSRKAELFRARTSDNPFLPEEYESENRAEYPETFASQEFDGEFLDDFGNQIKTEWIRYYTMQGDIIQVRGPDGRTIDAVDQRELRRFATIDTAGSSKDKAEEARGKVTEEDGTASWSVCAVWDYWRAKDLLILRHVWRGRVSWTELKVRTAQVLKDFNVKKVLIENATSGSQLAEELRQFGSRTISTVLPGMREGVSQRGAKMERAIASGLLKRAESNKLIVPQYSPAQGNQPKTWAEKYIDELTGWTGEPNETADQVDVSSYAAWETKQAGKVWGGVISN